MIICSAVKCGSRIYRGHRHHDAIRSACDHGEKPPIRQDEQGFLNGSGKFLSREKAAQEAFACGQIDEPKEKLFSEDLW